ncbi:MAG: hypothetical protein K2X57_03335 [Xanthobacteraceae bacterium]|nr:hypothetical protein [Xanthobacteraceae bacterium]
MNRILKPIVFLVAGIYFLADAAFWAFAKPVIRWLADHWMFDSIRNWVVSLGPYPTLALFVVPVLVLEPAKPVAAYLTATGHVVSGLLILGVAEFIKLVLIERLFSISRDKLMSIPVFAWGYDKFQQARSWVESLAAWRLARRVALTTKRLIRRSILEFKTSRKRQHVSWQSR